MTLQKMSFPPEKEEIGGTVTWATEWWASRSGFSAGPVACQARSGCTLAGRLGRRCGPARRGHMSTLLAAFNEGVSHSMSGDHEVAIQVFDRVLSQDPSHVLALSAKGSSLTSLGKPARRSVLRAGHRPGSRDGRALPQRGALPARAGRAGGGSSLLEEALQLNTELAWREATAVEIATLGEALLTESGKHRTRGIGLTGKARYRHARHVLEMALSCTRPVGSGPGPGGRLGAPRRHREARSVHPARGPADARLRGLTRCGGFLA